MKVDSTLQFWFLCLLRTVIWLVELVTDALFGYTYTRGSAEEREKARKYECSAHLVTIKWRAKYSLYFWTKEENFLYKHDKYVHPNYVLKNANITLLAVMDKYILFTVTHPTVDVHKTTQFPFMFLGEYLAAMQLVIMPTSSFHRLADELGDPKVPVGVINMTARCGSTLLAQMMNRVPNSRSMSEPWATVNLHELYGRGIISKDETKALLRSAYRLHCKIAPGENIEQIIMKMNPANAPQFPWIKELFPQFRYFFNTRHPVPSMKSLKQVIKRAGMIKTVNDRLSIIWRTYVDMGLYFPYAEKYKPILTRYNKWYQNIENDELLVIVYVGGMSSYFDKPSMYDHVILYENLVDDPEKELRTIYKLMNISEEHIPASLKAMEEDSQRGQFGKRGEARSYILSENMLGDIDFYLKDCGIPIRKDMTKEQFQKAFGF